MQLKAGLRPVRGFRGSVKTSMQAVTLQMAAAKKWGSKEFERLDRFTMSLPHPDATTAMLSGAGQINCHFTAAPFDFTPISDAHPRRPRQL